MIQGGGGIRGPAVVQAGGQIDVEVGTNDPEVTVVLPGGGVLVRVPVPPGKKARVPIPRVPPGTLLLVITGDGLRARVMVVEVVEVN